jgi:DNA-binding transcriptional ArsR family regulator
MRIHRIRCILSDVMAFDLIVLGRQLTRIGETVMRGQAPPTQPTIAGMVLADVFAHPGSSISEITARTGMPQSHVSETVARLREQGTVESFPPRRPPPHAGARQRPAPGQRHARRAGPG